MDLTFRSFGLVFMIDQRSRIALTLRGCEDFHESGGPDFRSAEVRLEWSGEEDRAVGLLVGLEEGDVEAGEGGAGAVEGVAELVFAVLVLEAQRHAAGLVVAEI